MRTAIVAITAACLLACSAETGGGAAAGDAGGLCLAEDACNPGLMCVSGYCVPELASQDGQNPNGPAATTANCEGRCGVLDDGALCQCDPGCLEREDCCKGICGVCGGLPDLASVCAPCVPECGDRVCGDDGCQGSCGECMGCGGPEDSLCQEGVCIEVCCPSCGANTCGSDGCGGSCGSCAGCDGPDESLCQGGGCVQACCGACDGLACGDDGCGTSCGACAEGELCTAGACVCVPKCSVNLCGPDGCDGICGTSELCAPSADITSPPDETVYTKGYEVTLQGVVEDPAYPYDELTVFWEIPGITTLYEGPPGLGGWTETTWTTTEEGPVTVMLRVENPAGLLTTDVVHLHVCSDGPIETFDEPLEEDGKWKTYQYAFWHEDGWLDMTDLDTWARGAVFNVQEQVNPGNVEIRFSICTGGGGWGMGGMMGGMGWDMGADGYAMSVVNVDNVEDLETFIYGAQDGGCLAYGVSGACGDMEITAFHVEFDTYFNQGNPMVDPTAANHVAITLDGDPGNHLLWAEYPLEDLEWHDVVVKTEGTYITVTIDDEEVIAGDIPLFEFHGGYIGFSGSTGAEMNYHRMDNLQIVEDCVGP